jgi:hypothetical protein
VFAGRHYLRVSWTVTTSRFGCPGNDDLPANWGAGRNPYPVLASVVRKARGPGWVQCYGRVNITGRIRPEYVMQLRLSAMPVLSSWRNGEGAARSRTNLGTAFQSRMNVVYRPVCQLIRTPVAQRVGGGRWSSVAASWSNLPVTSRCSYFPPGALAHTTGCQNQDDRYLTSVRVKIIHIKYTLNCFMAVL